MTGIIQGDCYEVLKTLPDGFIDCCVTSPPYYGLRDYGVDGQIGLEETPEEYINKLVDVFREVRRVLKDDGTLWVNIGDSYCNSNGYARASAEYQRPGRNDDPANDRDLTVLHNAGFKTKDLIGIPWMLAFALRADGWYLRQDIIWQKPNPMPESVKDRCTKSHEYIFLLSKKPNYYFDSKAIEEDADPKYEARYKSAFNSGQKEIDGGGRPNGVSNTAGMKQYTGKRNKRDVWNVAVKAIHEAHFATFPENLIKPCILAGSRRGGIILDPFFGSGTTGRVAESLDRRYLGIELNPEYVEIGKNRADNVQMTFEAFIG